VIVHSARSRIRAAYVNSGRFTFDEAESRLATKLSIHVSADVAGTPAGQAAVLTAVITGSRCFGQVSIDGALHYPLCIPTPLVANTLGDAVIHLGGTLGDNCARRTVLIGGASPKDEWSVRTFWNGWIAGVSHGSQQLPVGRGDCALAGVAAAAIAVGQAFFAEQGDVRAGRGMQFCSLWTPDIASNGLDHTGPTHYSLPLALWLIGLGNLGQAYLWSLATLPFAAPTDVLLYLQDHDLVRLENWGTSVLVKEGRYDVLKTMIAEEWAHSLGFQVRRIDRRMDENLRRSDSEPAIALAGLDRMPPRRLLGIPGFDHIVDAGLGATATDFRRFRLNVFDRTLNPKLHFAGVDDEFAKTTNDIKQLSNFKHLLSGGQVDECGIAQLAGIPVAVPFVSAFAGALALTQVIRLASGVAPYCGLTGDIGDLRSLRGTLGAAAGRPTFPISQARS
jgi:hypothetical protein